MAQAQFKTNIKAQTGNRLVVLLGGIQIGALQSVSSSDDYGPEAVSGIGDIHAIEHAPTMARHSISVSNMVLKKSELRKAGITIVNGDAALRGLVFEIESYDKDSGELLRKYTGVSYASGSVDVQKHAIVMASAQFNALDVTGDGI